MISSIRKRSSHLSLLPFLILLFFSVAANAQNSVVNAEYFFDKDPGPGSGFGLTLASNTTISASQLASVSSLSPGRHVVYVRLKSQEGNWGSPVGYKFLVTDSIGHPFIKQAEYFLDRDPGQGKGNFLPVPGSLSFQNITTTASTAGFSVSSHRLFVRFLDDRARWSAAIGVSFCVVRTTYIAGAEFFIDSLGLPGTGRAMSALDSVFNSPSEYAVAQVDTSNVHAGYHTVFVQVQSSDGRWSSIAKDSLFFNRALTVVESDSVEVPKKFNLSQNYPNPFNPSTIISYDVPKLSHVTLTIYDILGRQVATLVNEEKQPGSYQMTFDGSWLASGVYFYRLQAGTYSNTKKLLLLK